MRVRLREALFVCRVVMTRWQVSAAVNAVSKVVRFAHFADHDDIRVLAEGMNEGRLKAYRIQ